MPTRVHETLMIIEVSEKGEFLPLQQAPAARPLTLLVTPAWAGGFGPAEIALPVDIHQCDPNAVARQRLIGRKVEKFGLLSGGGYRHRNRTARLNGISVCRYSAE